MHQPPAPHPSQAGPQAGGERRQEARQPPQFLWPKPPPHSCVIRNSDSSCQGGPKAWGSKHRSPRWEHRGLLWCGGHPLKHPIRERKTRAAWSPAQWPTAAALGSQPPRPYSHPACSLTACTWVPESCFTSPQAWPRHIRVLPRDKSSPRTGSQPSLGDPHHHGCRGTTGHRGLLAWVTWQRPE